MHLPLFASSWHPFRILVASCHEPCLDIPPWRDSNDSDTDLLPDNMVCNDDRNDGSNGQVDVRHGKNNDTKHINRVPLLSLTL